MRIGITTMITDVSIAPDELAREVEAHGFDGLYVPEHTHIPSRGTRPRRWASPCPRPTAGSTTPFVALTAAAMATSRIRLGTGVALLAERDPIATAKAVASLDHLSGGRVTLGIGFGWNVEELADHGVDYERPPRRDRRPAGGHAGALGEEPTGFEGAHARVAPSEVHPTPTQERLPVWLGGGLGPRTLAFLVEHCDGWIPIGGSGLSEAIPRLRAALEDAGRDPDAFEIVPFGSIPTPASSATSPSSAIDQVVVNLPDASRDGARRFLEQTADVLARVG